MEEQVADQLAPINEAPDDVLSPDPPTPPESSPLPPKEKHPRRSPPLEVSGEEPRHSGRHRSQVNKYVAGSFGLGTAKSEGDFTEPDTTYLSAVELYTLAYSSNKPMSHTEAMRFDEFKLWAKTKTEEIDSLVEHGSWEIVPQPKGKSVVSCKLVYRVKYGQDGKVTHYKAQLVACGFFQIHGINYQEMFAPVTWLETI